MSLWTPPPKGKPDAEVPPKLGGPDFTIKAVFAGLLNLNHVQILSLRHLLNNDTLQVATEVQVRIWDEPIEQPAASASGGAAESSTEAGEEEPS